MIIIEINPEADSFSVNSSKTHLRISLNPTRAEQILGFFSPPFTVYSNDNDILVNTLNDQLYEATKDGGINQPLFVETLCISLLMHVNTRYLRARVRQHPRGRLTPSQLAMVSEYIHSRLGQNISLKDLCSLVNLSRYHFTRLFKGTLGTTPHRYILQCKVEYAKTLMTKRKGSILDAAYQLSFSDHAHFTNTFRKLTGITPKSFLRIESE
ncbi:MAG TPA: AraC family transcriptional regulator [Cyclobacteriaceae bacterium]|nr:AraC family transcriptional regulator [Cyclobacteriaceae bacterium]